MPGNPLSEMEINASRWPYDESGPINGKFGQIEVTAAKAIFDENDLTITITADNGSEFYDHELVVEKLRIDIYFTNPYSFWKRGLNENFNGLLRQYTRKGTAL